MKEEKDEPKMLNPHTQIQLTNQQFDLFITICKSEQQPSQKILDVAKRLDDEGFWQAIDSIEDYFIFATAKTVLMTLNPRTTDTAWIYAKP